MMNYWLLQIARARIANDAASMNQPVKSAAKELVNGCAEEIPLSVGISVCGLPMNIILRTVPATPTKNGMALRITNLKRKFLITLPICKYKGINLN